MTVVVHEKESRYLLRTFAGIKYYQLVYNLVHNVAAAKIDS